MLLRLRAGEREGGRRWVYARLARGGVVYVGATALCDPASPAGRREPDLFVEAIEARLQ